MSKLLKKKKVKENHGMICDIEFKTPHAKIIHALFLLVAIILSAVCIVPILWLVLSSFKDTKEFMAIPPSFLPKNIDINKFFAVWEETAFAKLYLGSVQRSCRLCGIKTQTPRKPSCVYAYYVDYASATQRKPGSAVYDIYKFPRNRMELV